MFETILSFAYLFFITVLVFVDFYLSYKTSKKEGELPRPKERSFLETPAIAGY